MAYAYSRSLTISASKCGSANSANFPVYFAGDASLATVSNGGNARSSNGYDIGFYADAGLTQKLPWELVAYNPATGAGEWWIQVPVLSASVNTIFYIAYGDSTITTDQSNRTAVWDSYYTSVYHMGGSSLSLADSTANAATLTQYGSVTSGPAFLNGAGAVYPGGSASYLTAPNPPIGTTDRTFSCWINAGFSSGQSAAVLTDQLNGSGLEQRWLLYQQNYNTLVLDDSGGGLNWGYHAFDDTWHYVVLACAGGDDRNAVLYLDGVAASSSPNTYQNNYNTTAGPAYLFTNQDGQALTMQGTGDEVRYSTVARSASWVTSEYNNQYSPTTFYTLGAQQTAAVTTSVIPALFLLGW